MDYSFLKLAFLESCKSHPIKSAYCVGAIIIDPKTSQILSRGYSREIEGNTHAEQCALMKIIKSNNDSEKNVQKGVYLYCTMEPCSHRNSGNVSCLDRIIQWNAAEKIKIERIVIGVVEPKLFVEDCVGVRMLEKEGICVVRIPLFSKYCLNVNDSVL